MILIRHLLALKISLYSVEKEHAPLFDRSEDGEEDPRMTYEIKRNGRMRFLSRQARRCTNKHVSIVERSSNEKDCS